MRNLSPIDQFICQSDKALKAVNGGMSGKRPSPSNGLPNDDMDYESKLTSARLMRVNHCGEVCAQALYQGQALTASNRNLTQQLEKAAEEEQDHLAWCEDRIKELNGHVSYLNPLWYGGSFLMGAIAGMLGDRINLGFVAATEEEVCKHLDRHLQALPPDDQRSQAILEVMKSDESQHEAQAIEAGGLRFSPRIKRLMATVSATMTRSTYWF